MRKKILLLLFTCTFLSAFSQEDIKKDSIKKTVTTFYLINSAEKKAATEEQKDPYLTESGVERSKKWTEILSTVKLDDVYSINSTSAKQTAQVIAESKKLTVYQFNTEAMYDIGFKYNTDGKNVLIVGNNTTTTKFANSVLGKEKFSLVKNDNFGRLYILTLTEDTKTPIVLTID